MLLRGFVALRRRLSVVFDDTRPPGRVVQAFNISLAVLIIANVTGVILESVPSIHDRYEAPLEWFEHVATLVFAAEYVLRVWAAVELDARYRQPLWGRLRYMRSFFALIDLVAVLPAILGLFGAADLRTLRLLRLLRMLKLTRHATVFNLLWGVFVEEARAIGAILFILFLTLTISASVMYMIEGDAPNTEFLSIPAAMWWAIETLTTVGYGDMVPTTPLGRVVGGIVSVVGIVALALFTGLITVSFMDQLRVRRTEHRPAPAARRSRPVSIDGLPTGDVCPHCGHRLREHAAAP
jgi:voltage-gated potassium channel